MGGNGNLMKVDESQLASLKIEDKSKYEDAITYMYAGTDPAAVHKPITIYKEKNANAYLVAGRYASATETELKYKPLNEEEQKIVVGKLGSGKVIKFLSKETVLLP
jgi:hypothetical protein